MISVIMPVYNAGKFLHESIESVLRQTEKIFELIIVNDGSTDNSENIILSFTDPRIKYFNQKHGGGAAARNTALDQVSGDFIVFQDADDISLPNRFETLKRHFTSQSIGIVHSDMLLINRQNQLMGYITGSNIEKAQMLRFFLKAGTPFINASMMVRSKALQGFRYDQSLRVGEDTDMVFKIARNWVTVHVPEPLYLYRRHSTNVTNHVDYATTALHTKKFLERHSLVELFPELDWENEITVNNQAMASAIVSLFLFRRKLIHDARNWYEKATKLMCAPDVENFVSAIGKICTGDCEGSVKLLESCAVRNHVIENYLGEAKAKIGRTEQAFHHFCRALQLNPHYIEPIGNLKLLGRNLGYSIVGLPGW